MGLILIMMSFALNAQDIKIVDSSSGEPIANATLSTIAHQVQTNAKGLADLSLFGPTDTLLIQHVSFYERFITLAELSGRSELKLAKRAYQIRPITISANKWEQNERKISDQITLLDARTIERLDPANAADLLASSGEVFVQKSQGGGGSPMIRGFSANRVLIVVDGVRMNNAIYRSGNLQNVLNVDPNMLRVAEVIHGPGAMTYGSDAIGGVMDFHTFDPVLKNDSLNRVTGSVLYRRTGASEESTFHLRLNAAWNTVALMAGFTASDFGDPLMGANGPDEYLRPFFVRRIDGRDSVFVNPEPRRQVGNEYQLGHTIAKLRWKPEANWNVVLSARNSNAGRIPRYDRLIQENGGEPIYAEWNYSEQNWSMFSGKVENYREKGAWNKARLSLAYQSYQEGREDRRLNAATRRNRSEEVQGFWANFDFEKDLGDSTELFYGFESVTNTVYSYAFRSEVDTFVFPFVEINPRYPNNSEWYNYSAYASVTSELKKDLIFNGGMRFNYSGLDVFFDTTLFQYPVTTAELSNFGLTGSAGLIWHPTEEQKVSFDLSRGFRSPNIDDIGKVFDSEPGAVVIPNADLDAEYVYSAELGIQQDLSEKLTVSSNIYYSILDNAIVRRPFELNGQDSIAYDGVLSGVQALQNAAQARVYGLHLGGKFQASEYICLDMHVNFQNGEEELDDGTIAPSRHAPPAFGRFEFRFDKKKWSASFAMVGSLAVEFEDLAPSEQAKPHIYAIDSNGNPYSPQWYSLDANLRYLFLDGFSLNLGLQNMTDQRYRTYSSGVVAPGRNITASIRATF